MTKIENFIQNLEKFQTSENVFNIYQGNSNESKIRRDNLFIYLTLMGNLSPSVLFVGEAPGYNGCKLTGIPFTSEKILISETHFDILGIGKGYKSINPLAVLKNERSATIFWNELKNYKKPPLIWNIFPFHPFILNNQESNRPPNTDELKCGKKILTELLEIYNIKTIVAIGRKAQDQLSDLNDIKLSYIRHPANDKNKDFAKGLKLLMDNK